MGKSCWLLQSCHYGPVISCLSIQNGVRTFSVLLFLNTERWFNAASAQEMKKFKLKPQQANEGERMWSFHHSICLCLLGLYSCIYLLTSCWVLALSGIGNKFVGVYLIQLVKRYLSDVLNPCNIFIWKQKQYQSNNNNKNYLLLTWRCNLPV